MSRIASNTSRPTLDTQADTSRPPAFATASHDHDAANLEWGESDMGFPSSVVGPDMVPPSRSRLLMAAAQLACHSQWA